MAARDLEKKMNSVGVPLAIRWGAIGCTLRGELGRVWACLFWALLLSETHRFT